MLKYKDILSRNTALAIPIISVCLSGCGGGDSDNSHSLVPHRTNTDLSGIWLMTKTGEYNSEWATTEADPITSESDTTTRVGSGTEAEQFLYYIDDSGSGTPEIVPCMYWYHDGDREYSYQVSRNGPAVEYIFTDIYSATEEDRDAVTTEMTLTQVRSDLLEGQYNRLRTFETIEEDANSVTTEDYLSEGTGSVTFTRILETSGSIDELLQTSLGELDYSITYSDESSVAFSGEVTCLYSRVYSGEYQNLSESGSSETYQLELESIAAYTGLTGGASYRENRSTEDEESLERRVWAWDDDSNQEYLSVYFEPDSRNQYFGHQGQTYQGYVFPMEMTGNDFSQFTLKANRWYGIDYPIYNELLDAKVSANVPFPALW